VLSQDQDIGYVSVLCDKLPQNECLKISEDANIPLWCTKRHYMKIKTVQHSVYKDQQRRVNQVMKLSQDQ
jgi:hypothetical protein